MTQNNVIQFPARKPVPAGDLPASTPSSVSEVSVAQSNPSQLYDIHSFIPRRRTIALIEVGGVHIIPHKIFEFMIKATATRIETAVFACLIRYTLGFHRSACRASYTYISEWTGLSVASVRKGLEALLEGKLILCLESGTFATPAVYEIPLIKAYLSSKNDLLETKENSTKPESNKCKSPSSQVTQKSSALCTQGAQVSAVQSAPSMHSSVPPVCTKKERTETNKETTHTQEPIPEFLKAYLSNLKPEQKRVKELRHFESLKKAYSILDISDAVKILCEEGLPGSKENCHSPMAFLGTSMEAVQAIVFERRDATSRRLARENTEAEQKRMQAEKEASEKLEQSEALAKFTENFPTEELQNEYFLGFSKRYPFFTFGSHPQRIAAVNCWYSENKQTLKNS